MIKPHQQRVFDEKEELDEKRAKLREFLNASPLFVELPEAEKERLTRQLSCMGEYSDILQERISAFE